MPKKRKIDNPLWQDQQEKWWYDVWSGVGSPWRPSKREVKFFEKYIKEVTKRQNPKVLILGATPEFRDMLFKYKNIEVTLLDINPSVKRAMDRLCSKKNRCEKIVWGDWLKMPLPSDYFDAILSDEGFENIVPQKHDLLHRNIKRVLKDDGYFLVGRLCLEYSFKHPLTFEKVFEKYKSDLKFFKNSHNRIWYLYRLAVSRKSKAYEYKIQGVRFDILAKEIIAKSKKAGIKDPKYLFWESNIDYQALEYLVEIDLESLQQMKSMIRKFFKIEKTYQDLFHPVMKIKYNFVLTPKR